MRRALELAALGPAVGDHARVGAVILSPAGDVLGEGWHRGAGTPHAEVAAMAEVPAEQLRGATAVVTLEPCNHVGRTGPCALALIEAGVGRVVYAVDDPGEHAHGGADRLRAAGVDVVSGLLADEAEAFLERWLLSVRTGRPWVTVKWASSLDGRVAAADGTSRWITGAAARQHVHEQRAAHDAILVGTGTVLADDPSLTARGDAGELLADQPLPVVVGDRAVPDTAAVRRHPRGLLALPGHDLAARSAPCATTASTRCSSRAVRRSPRRSSRTAWSTRCSSTSPRSCSAAPGSRSATSGWEASATAASWT